MKNVRIMISILMSIFMVLSVAACGTPATSTPAESTQAESTSASTTQSMSETSAVNPATNEKIEFSYILPTKFYNWLKDLQWYPEFEKAVNAEVSFLEGGDGGTYYSNIDLKVASKEFPDAGVVKIAQATYYGAQGAFLDLKPLIDEYAPNIKKFIENNPDYALLVTNKDGTIYGLPAEIPKYTGISFYRVEHFEKAGITKEPRTIAELTDAFRALKETYKDESNYYPYSGQETFLIFQSVFNANDNIDSNGKVHGMYQNGKGYDIHSPGYKELVQWYNQLYTEGLVDPEWVSGEITEIVWETKVITGKTSFSDNWFTYPTYFMVNANNPEYHIKVMPYLLDQKGEQALRAASERFNMDRTFVISSLSKDKAKSIMQYMDFVFSAEGQTIRSYGVEGKTYKVVDGKKEYLIKFEEEWPKKLGEPNLGFFQDRLTFPGPVDNDGFTAYLDENTKSYAKDFFGSYGKVFSQLKYSAEQLEERSNLVAQVSEAIDANIVKFVTGKRPMSEFDAFIKEMDAQGYTRINEIDQEAFDAYK